MCQCMVGHHGQMHGLLLLLEEGVNDFRDVLAAMDGMCGFEGIVLVVVECLCGAVPRAGAPQAMARQSARSVSSARAKLSRP
jgi:hypothetical protein